MSDRIVVMDDGMVQQFAPPLERYNEPANQFVASFIGSPSMNFISGVVTAEGLETPYFDISLDIESFGLEKGEHMTLGIRPEDIYSAGKINDEQAYSASVPAEVDVVEPTGNRVMTYLIVGDASSPANPEDNELLMEVEPDTDINEGDTLNVHLDRAKIHLFDQSGQAIAHGIEDMPTSIDAAGGSSKMEN